MLRLLTLAPDRARRAGAYIVAALLAWKTASVLLPSGLPVGVVMLGTILGALTSLTAIGLVLIYRSTRIINFAQAEIGGLAAAVSVVMVTGWKLPYVVAVPAGLGFALATGWVIDALVVRPFTKAPRMILTVATIGVAQILGYLEVNLPKRFAHLGLLTTFTTPFRFHFRVGALIFDGDDVIALLVVPLVLIGFTWFFAKSDTGVAVRAAADSNDRALLLGIPVRKLSRITWMLAAGLSGLSAILVTPILGANIGLAAGPVVLLAPLAAAVIGGMESLPKTFAASIGIGIFQQAVFWSFPRSTTVDVALFVVVLIALLAQRRRHTRTDDAGLGGYVSIRELRPLSSVVQRLPETRATKAAGAALLLAVAVVLPLFLPRSKLELFTYTVISALIAVSLVVLTGWSGQISLGQFAFAGVGAVTTGGLLAHTGADLFLALVISGLAGMLVAVVIGIPAARIPGPLLAVATLAFAVPVSTYLVNASYFPSLNPPHIDRPILFDRFDLSSPRAFYFLCLTILALAVSVARNYRSTRPGRVVRAVRDNERGAASFSIDPLRVKLTAFAFSGMLAGIAGGLYVVALRGVPYAGFDPITSLTVFTTTVIGGMAMIAGAVLGAIASQAGNSFGSLFLSGTIKLLAPGIGLIVVLMQNPGGIAEDLFRRRNDLLRRAARRRGYDLPGAHREEGRPSGTRDQPKVEVEPPSMPSAILSCRAVEASYGQVQVLFGVDMEVDDGEIVALLGTNGAGKSTVLGVIAGLLPPGHGTVWFDSRDVTRLGPVERVRAGLVTVPGGHGVFPSLTVAENLRLAGWLSRDDTAFLDATRQRIFELFPSLLGREDVNAGLLSGGEQQMLTIAMAMFCRPRLLMIDELSLGLAPAVVTDLLAAVRAISAAGTTVIVVEQSVNVATSLAHRAIFMEKGEVRFTGPTAELANRTDLLRSIFLRPSDGPKARTGSKPTASDDADDPDQMPVLEIAGVTRHFGGVLAVDGVDLTVGTDEIIGLIGSNGAGKTTLVDICSGFVAPDAGRVLLRGRDVTGLSASARADLGLGRSFQDARLFPTMTVVETISVALERHVTVREPFICALNTGAVIASEREVAARVDELVAVMGLEQYRDSFISELSTGTRRIVELACAMAHEPSVLLLDEPSSGIAQRESEALADVLLSLRETTGAALVVIEHDIPLISSIADRLVCLHVGRVIAEGAPTDVLTDNSVIASYLGNEEAAVQRSNGYRPGARRAPKPLAKR